MERKFGAHMSIAGGHEKAVQAAASYGFRSVQLFTKNNNQWNAPPLRPEGIDAFRKALDDLEIVDPVAHTSYLINIASPDDSLWERSIDALTVEVERCEALGIADLVLHPGAHTGSGEEAGLARAAAGLDEVFRRTPGGTVRIDLETTAGQGTCLGHRIEHLGAILERAAATERLGICCDTCHLFAAGYALESRNEYDDVIDQLDRAVGLHRIRAWHLNDSARERGSRVDRHAAIGRGHMGLEPFRHLVNDARFAHLPLLLETPKGTEEGEDWDAINLRTLRSLCNPEAAGSHDRAGVMT